MHGIAEQPVPVGVDHRPPVHDAQVVAASRLPLEHAVEAVVADPVTRGPEDVRPHDAPPRTNQAHHAQHHAPERRDLLGLVDRAQAHVDNGGEPTGMGAKQPDGVGGPHGRAHPSGRPPPRQLALEVGLREQTERVADHEQRPRRRAGGLRGAGQE